MRKEIFRELVETQDQAIGVKQSRKLICERFGLTDDDVREIEREGLDAEWPPLS
jgi:crotonobetainyl-CoA:carnitine CoA-transferase CaiB-like acyl-CoA transferase